MKCRVCRGAAVIDIRRHNAAFCGEHFVHHCREQVRRGIKEHEMLHAGEQVLVAVSGGNVMRWETGYLGRQHPVLPPAPGFVRKVKPLIRLGEREMAAYCVLEGIDYIVEECPMAAGNRHLGYEEALNALEDRSPGPKAAFVFGFLDRAQPQFAGDAREEREALGECAVCGSPTTGEVCAFCRLRERAST